MNHRLDIRRLILLVLGIGGLAVGLMNQWVDGDSGSRGFASNSAFRMGVVMIAIWLALPTLNKPMRWLPPGVAVACLVAIGALAAQPRLLIVAIPAAGVLLSMTWLVRMFRAQQRR